MAKRTRLTRQQAERRGRWAETAAELLLRLKGYSVVARRVKLRMGEIDLIAARGKTLAFVEVKQRKTLDLAQTAVTPKNWQRISNAASAWTARRQRYANYDWRYDLIAVTPWAVPKHYKNFWNP